MVRHSRGKLCYNDELAHYCVLTLLKDDNEDAGDVDSPRDSEEDSMVLRSCRRARSRSSTLPHMCFSLFLQLTHYCVLTLLKDDNEDVSDVDSPQDSFHEVAGD